MEKRRVIYILVAKTEQQELFYLTGQYERQELQEIRKRKQFFCPSCQAPLLLKIGEINIPHFAHKILSACDYFSEPESSLHLQGKLLLHHFFQQRNFKVELENYLPEIRQRADLLVNGRHAIEFQCSTISAQHLQQRSQGYHQLNLQDIWIKGLKEPCNEGIGLLRIKAHEIAMRQKAGPVSFILLFYPPNNRFYYHSNLFFVSSNRWIGKTKSIPAAMQVFPFAVPKPLSKKEFKTVMEIFMNEKKKYIRNQLYAENRIRNVYCRLCYELQLDMTNLPGLIGVPVLGAEYLKEPVVLWQLQAVAAWEKGIPLANLIRSGKLTLSAGTEAGQAAAILEDYLSWYLSFKDHSLKDSSLLDIVYDNYCKTLRKLRK